MSGIDAEFLALTDRLHGSEEQSNEFQMLIVGDQPCVAAVLP